MRKQGVGIICSLVLVIGEMGYGMATEQIGPDPADPPTVAQPGWPKRIEEVLRHQSRVYSIWVNGNENFYFQATPEDVNELVTLFSKARMRDHEVAIAAQRRDVKTFGGDAVDYNVSLQIVAGIALFMTREGQSTSGLPLEPRLTIYPGDDASLLEKVTWPENLTLTNEVEGLSLPRGRIRPKREVYYGRLEFADGSPTQDFVMGLNSRITLWEEGEEDGIEVGSVNNQGCFSVLLSEQEIAGLQAGRIWLTATISNYLTEAHKTDRRIPFETLARDKDQAQVVQVEGSPYYYGRVLFEDGTPPILDPAPWPGAEISLSFSYAGMATPDAEGYFKVMLTAEQVEKLSADRPQMNIYIPDPVRTGRSTARFAFPVGLLSQDKAKAGVVRIPRPIVPPKDLPTAESMLGETIPGFDGIRFDAFEIDQADGKPLLVCLWDVEQRSSRQCVETLEEHKDVLQAKGLTVLIVHARAQSAEQAGAWLRENGITLTVGAVDAEAHDVLLSWGAKGAPWLVLTNGQHVVTREGFGLDEIVTIADKTSD